MASCVLRIRLHYIDIDRDGHEISRFGGLPRELYSPKGLYFPEVRSTEGKYCPEGKHNCLGTTDTWYVRVKLTIVIPSGKVVEYIDWIWDKWLVESRSVHAWHAQSDTQTVECKVFIEGVEFICHDLVNFGLNSCSNRCFSEGRYCPVTLSATRLTRSRRSRIWCVPFLK